MKLTLISHFYNEEYLLPFWIKHYINMVDEAILIDYASTDNSIDIIKTLAPHWQIIPSKNKYFDTENIDKEVMEIESTITDWKMVMNTTEFVLKKDLKSYLKEFDKAAPGFGAISTTGVWIVDNETTRSIPLDENKSIVEQRQYGFFEEDRMPIKLHPLKDIYLTHPSRSRLIHNKKHGDYYGGRHISYTPNYRDPNLLLAWFAYSPFDYIKQRKLNIYKRKSKEFIEEVIKIHGEDYFYSMVAKNEEDLELKFKHFSEMSYDLSANEHETKSCLARYAQHVQHEIF